MRALLDKFSDNDTRFLAAAVPTFDLIRPASRAASRDSRDDFSSYYAISLVKATYSYFFMHLFLRVSMLIFSTLTNFSPLFSNIRVFLIACTLHFYRQVCHPSVTRITYLSENRNLRVASVMPPDFSRECTSHRRSEG